VELYSKLYSFANLDDRNHALLPQKTHIQNANRLKSRAHLMTAGACTPHDIHMTMTVSCGASQIASSSRAPLFSCRLFRPQERAPRTTANPFFEIERLLIGFDDEQTAACRMKYTRWRALHE
jgi:hypothetical protein